MELRCVVFFEQAKIRKKEKWFDTPLGRASSDIDELEELLIGGGLSKAFKRCFGGILNSH